MSDNIKDLAEHYEENVFFPEHPRRIGLFTIPEYPEYEAKRGMWSSAIDAILTTLRYLAPATLLTLFWGQQSFLFRILKHIDSAFRAIVFSSEEQKQAVLQWLAEAGPVRVDHLDTVWRQGWILCGVLDAALPGACAGHPPTRLSLKHAQAIADHYLGVEPVFSRSELESNDSLSRHQEWKLATYVDRIRQALTKLTPPVSKPTSQRTSPETTQFTLDYVAKGSGLLVAQIKNKMYFKVYPTAQQGLDPGEITILIKGPKDSYGTTVLPPILGKAQLIRQKLLGLQSKQNFTENILPITQGATYLRSYGRNDMSKTYFIPKTKYDIEIEAESRPDHVKVSYVLNLDGKYEISITSSGQNIVGSPFNVTASHNILDILEKDSFCLEDGEEIDIVDVKTDRKVVFRIVDFVTEKMLIKENGILEKISDDEAKILMSTNINKQQQTQTNYDDKISFFTNNYNKELNTKKFNAVVHKVLKMNRVCKIFNDLIFEKQMQLRKTENKFIHQRKQKDIPDIVNSTLTEKNHNPYVLSENRDKFIVPESISVSLRTEKSKSLCKEDLCNDTIDMNNIVQLPMQASIPNNLGSLQQYDITQGEEIEDDNISVGRMTTTSSNPFLADMCEDNYNITDLGTFVATEYETNNSQNEETRESSIKIIIDTNSTPSPTNPFLDTNIIESERPKTPVFKIISGENISRDDSGYLDPKSEFMCEEILGNEFINPFFVHQHIMNIDHSNLHQVESHQSDNLPVTDFIIGAPVSMPPIVRPTSPQPNIKSILLSNQAENISTSNINNNKKQEDKVKEFSPSIFSTPSHRHTDKPVENNLPVSSTFHSLESNLTELVDNSNASTSSENQFEPYRFENLQSNRNISPKKDIWDSAYVSIDDNNSTPDSNNNESTVLCETFNKLRFPFNDDNGVKPEDLSYMGPAEREIWQTCFDLKENSHKIQEDTTKPIRWEFKRPMFTPIIEESDRSISSGVKDLSRSEMATKPVELDQVSVAFAELNDMYHEYFPTSESNSTTTANDDAKLQRTEVEYMSDTKDTHVNSASEQLSDVKRHTEAIEGTISEVQSNVTESLSASQTLQDNNDIQSLEFISQNKDETQFGDNKRKNIVLERKKYWDDKIRQIQAKSEETTKLQKRRRISSRQLKNNDSLSKRKGKQIVKNFLTAGDCSIKSENIITKQSDDMCSDSISRETSEREEIKADVKLVEKWKKYWDNKLETEFYEKETVKLRIKSPQSRDLSPSTKLFNEKAVAINEKTESNNDESILPVKQELPEEVFKAFETSPKRFFGTSRKRILNKIDTFLGKPIPIDSLPTDVVDTSFDTGLVSSRISLFHNMSYTEEPPCELKKTQLLQSICQRKDSGKICEENIMNIDSKKESKTPEPKEEIENKCVENNTEKIAYYENITNKDSEPVTNENLRDNILEIPTNEPINKKQNIYVIKTEKENDKKNDSLRRTSISKSEMDIFSKVPNASNDCFDKYRSCDQLPKINVKNFISLYESVTKTAVESKPAKRMYRTSSMDSQKILRPISITSDAVNEKLNYKAKTTNVRTSSNDESTVQQTASPKPWTSLENINNETINKKTDPTDSNYITTSPNDDKETPYQSLSDIELEIIENTSDNSPEPSPERTVDAAHIEYKSRFKIAKQFFQSLEELREVKKPRKLNECELLLQNKLTESLENERPRRRVKKNIKSHSMPSSEIRKIWNQMKENQDGETSSTKLVKISEKFNVEDLFNDVMEGRLSRQGSLRGIPHKKAVLEAFRSMENVSDTKMSSYEIAVSQLNDFAKENRIKNAQTYLSEYPYLPTTDPSKYHSRLDTKASGLITFKELLEKKPRRNSVPDLRLNPRFTVDL